MKQLATACCLLAFAATPALAADAPHVQQRIVPGQAIGKVALGMSLAQVRKALGAPQSTNEKRNLGFGKTFIEYGWNFGEWRVAFVKGRVVRVGSSIRTEKTREGIGVGTEGHKVQRTFGVTCLYGFFKDGGRFAHYWCVVRARGGARTAFVVATKCKRHYTGTINCPGNEVVYEVVEVWIFAPGEPLPVDLYPDQKLP
jgi:hypothetical protein